MMLTRRHDRYLLKAFWATFLAVVFFLTVITLILDLSDRMRRVNRNWETIIAQGYDPLVVMLEFYATFVPFIWLRILPFCVPLAAAFTLARLNRHNELTPLLAVGVSMRRIVWPIVLSGILVAGGMLASREYLVPQLSRMQMKAARILSRDKPNRISRVPHFHDPSGARLSMSAYLPIDRKCEGVSVTHWAEDGSPTQLERYPELAWDDAREVWVATSGGVRIPLAEAGNAFRRLPVPRDEIVGIQAPISLLEISLTRTRSAGMSFSETRELMAANPTNGRFRMLYHELFTGPISTLVLLFVALPFCVYLGRKSAIPGMLASLGMAALFFGSGFLLASLGAAGEMSPVLLAWLPTVLFGSLGLGLYLGLD